MTCQAAKSSASRASTCLQVRMRCFHEHRPKAKFQSSPMFGSAVAMPYRPTKMDVVYRFHVTSPYLGYHYLPSPHLIISPHCISAVFFLLSFILTTFHPPCLINFFLPLYSVYPLPLISCSTYSTLIHFSSSTFCLPTFTFNIFLPPCLITLLLLHSVYPLSLLLYSI